MADVEFLGPDSDPLPYDEPTDDVVELEPRRIPRGLTIGGFVLAAVLVVSALVARGSGHDTPPPQAGPPPSRATSESSGREALAPLPVSPIGRVISDEQLALDVALAGNILYALRYDTLSTSDAFTGTPISRIRVSGLDYFYGGPTMHLALDPTTSTAWVFTEQVLPPRILEFSSASLRRRRGLLAPAAIYGAATMGGNLYVATAKGIAVVAPGRAPVLLPHTSGLIASIAADPVRNRLLAIDSDSPQHLLTVTPSGAVTVDATIAPLVFPTIAVAGGHIWLAGTTDSGDAVVRLNPTSLLPVSTSPVGPRAGVGVSLVGGESVVWVASGGGTERQQLWCLDAASGAIGGYWPNMTGAVSSRVGLAYAVRDGGVVGIPVSPRCPG